MYCYQALLDCSLPGHGAAAALVDPCAGQDSTEASSLAQLARQPVMENPASSSASTTVGETLDEWIDLFLKQAANLSGMAQRVLLDMRNRHQAALRSPPEVAVLLQGDQLRTPPRPPLLKPETICAEAELKYKGRMSRLLVLQPSPGSPHRSASEQILKLTGEALPLNHPKVRSDKVWPLHSWEVSEAVVALHVLLKDFPLSTDKKFEVKIWGKRLKRMLRRLVIRAPADNGPYLSFLRYTYGEQVAATFSAKFFHAQMLWIMAGICVFFLILDATLHESTKNTQRRALEVCTILWGICASVLGWYRFVQPVNGKDEEDPNSEADNRIRRCSDTPPQKHRCLKLLFLAVPALLLFCSIVMLSFLVVMQLIFHVVYTWGDCLNLTTEDAVCRDAQMKHGFLGWLVEVLCDILLVVLFEIFFPLSELLARWIANLRGFEFVADRKYFIWSLIATLAVFESLAFRACYGFIFTPQWTDPNTTWDVDNIPYGCDIFQTWCKVQKRLNVEDRRYIFERLTKGPFVVAPFIAIVMKVITPIAAGLLNKFAHMIDTSSWFGKTASPVRYVTRILALIFAYDGGHAGWIDFFEHGRPWGDLRMTYPPSAEALQAERKLQKEIMEEEADDVDPMEPYMADLREMLNSKVKREVSRDIDEAAHGAARAAEAKCYEAMQQFLHKRFEPSVEILEVNLHFIGVLFFAPIMPWGVLTLLGAKVLEVSFGMVKMLYVRRRAFPEPDLALRKSQVGFMVAAVFCATGWHVGLNLIAYNDSWYKWGDWRGVVMVLVMMWISGAALVLLQYNEANRVDPAKLEAAFRQKFVPRRNNV